MSVPQLTDELVEAMCRPEGTITFAYSSPQLFDRTAGAGVLLGVVTGAMLFRLERDADLNLSFVHSAPGTGSRVATLNLAPFSSATGIVVYLVWSPEELRLHVGDKERKLGLHEASGEPSDRRFVVGSDRAIAVLGDSAVEVFGARAYGGGETIIAPAAREAWRDTVRAMETLLRGSSDEGFLFDSVQTNAVISMLVTGFETYCETRFRELELEGIVADFDALSSPFKHQVERLGGQDKIKAKARESGVSPSNLLADQINFQEYEQCKDAFRTGYGIRFAEELDLSSDDIRDLKQAIKFRHRIIHVSPLLDILNGPEVPPAKPVFTTPEFASQSIALFDRFIQGLHDASLRLRPRESD